MPKVHILFLFLAVFSWAREFHNPGKFKINVMNVNDKSISKVTTIPTIYHGQKMCAYIGRLVYEIPDSETECPVIYLHHIATIQSTKDGLACGYDVSNTGKIYMYVDNYRKSCPDILVSKSGYKFIDSLFYDYGDNIKDYFVFDIIPQEFEVSDDDLYKYPELRKQIDVRQSFDRANDRKKSFKF